MIEKEFNWFLENQEELVKKYNGKILVIVDQEVKGAFDTDPEAYGFATKNFDYGSFLLQECVPGEEAYTITFHTGIKFK